MTQIMGKSKIILILSLISMFIQIGILSCGSYNQSRAGGARAENLSSPMPGYSCFIIRDDNGVGVGGNCVQSQ